MLHAGKVLRPPGAKGLQAGIVKCHWAVPWLVSAHTRSWWIVQCRVRQLRTQIHVALLQDCCLHVLCPLPAAADHSALQRYVRMPDTAGEAFYQALAELYLGTAAGVAGLLLDPAAGMRLQGALGVAGVLVGLLKGTGGLMVRPVMGVMDASSKILKGVGLLCLGRRGIQGKLVRRVRAPGALEGPGAGAGGGAGALAVFGRQMGAAGRPTAGLWVDDAALHAALVASWQARLPALASELAGDTVMDVLATRSCRLLLLTRQHVLYLRAQLPTRGQNAGSCSYSLRWLLPCGRVDHVRGAEESLRIILEYHSQLRVPDVQAWRQRRQQQHRLDKAAAAAAAAEAARPGQDGTQQQQGRAVVAGAASSGQTGGAAAGAANREADSSSAAARVLLRVPLHRSLRCASAELYQQVIRAVSRHLVQAEAAAAAGAAVPAAAAAGGDAGDEQTAMGERSAAMGRGVHDVDGYGDLYLVV